MDRLVHLNAKLKQGLQRCKHPPPPGQHQSRGRQGCANLPYEKQQATRTAKFFNSAERSLSF